jgi:oligoribonuclease
LKSIKNKLYRRIVYKMRINLNLIKSASAYYSNLKVYFKIGEFTRLIHTEKFKCMAGKSTNTSVSDEGRIVWVDLEMSGLDINKDVILEMACIVTDKDLNIVAESEDLIIKQDDSILNSMDEWCTKTHGSSGLTAAVKNSNISISQAEEQMTKFIQDYVPKGVSPLAGNTIHMDKMFLNKYMPKFVNHLHYRLIDVSTIKELVKRWYPNEKIFLKKNTHRALDDIRESIDELKFYRASIFK